MEDRVIIRSDFCRVYNGKLKNRTYYSRPQQTGKKTIHRYKRKFCCQQYPCLIFLGLRLWLESTVSILSFFRECQSDSFSLIKQLLLSAFKSSLHILFMVQKYTPAFGGCSWHLIRSVIWISFASTIICKQQVKMLMLQEHEHI